MARAAIDGIGRSQGHSGVDVGAAEEPMVEELPPAAPEEPVSAEVEAAPEPTEAFELLSAPRGAPDDLAKLTGVGPQMVKKLNDAGIFHYWQFVAMKAEDVTRIDEELKLHGRIERDSWINQARTLLDAA